MLERTPGLKKIAIRTLPDGGTVEEKVAPELVEQLCLDDDQLAELDRARRALRGGLRAGARHRVGVRRRRALPAPVPRDHARAERASRSQPPSAPVEVIAARAALRRAGPTARSSRSPRLFKERRFAAGETVTKEGAGGAAFFVIESGEATVTIGGELRATLEAGRLLRRGRADRRGRALATITAATELVCYGLTLWEFRPLVQENGAIGWKLLQTLAKDLREAEQVIADLRGRASAAGD